jgi:hypothetical protein
VGGKFLLKLNIDKRPIANKYREGKMQRTLKRELKEREIVNGEAIKGASVVFRFSCFWPDLGFKVVELSLHAMGSRKG